MTTLHNHSSPYQIKICTVCPGLEALDKVLLSWIPGTNIQEKFCKTCGTTLPLYQEVGLYHLSQRKNWRVKGVKVCTICPPDRAGLLLSWSGSIQRHIKLWDCNLRHGATFEFFDWIELQRLNAKPSPRREFLPFAAGTENVADRRRSIGGWNEAISTIGKENETESTRTVKSERATSPLEEDNPLSEKLKTSRPESGNDIPSLLDEDSDEAQISRLLPPQPKKTWAETRLDIALAIASKVATQTTPEDGTPSLDFFGPIYTPPPPPRSSTIKRRTSEFIFSTRNERTFNKLIAPRRVSFADHIEIKDDYGRIYIMEEDVWKSRPGAGSMRRGLMGDQE